jgi:glycosyltransferase involved in cell wall biosynthesis
VVSSESARTDLLRFYTTDADRVTVLPFCTIPDPAWYDGNPRDVQTKYHLPERFLVVCNQFWEHKNHGLVWEALARLREEGLHPNVVCTGPLLDYRNPMHLDRTVQTLHQYGLAGQVSLLGRLPRIEQVQVIRASLGLIQPSLFEGWSTVVEDGRLLGKSLILSDIPVHREQNPPAATYFDPHDADRLARQMATLWQEGIPGPDWERERAARLQADLNGLAFARRFLALAGVRSESTALI